MIQEIVIHLPQLFNTQHNLQVAANLPTSGEEASMSRT